VADKAGVQDGEMDAVIDELLKQGYGIDEIAAGLLDLGDEKNPDLGSLPGDGAADLANDIWSALQRIRERGA
jgi:hypothetical protein